MMPRDGRPEDRPHQQGVPDLGKRHLGRNGSGGNYLTTGDVDDTPVNGVTFYPVSSNWAYDHVYAVQPHLDDYLWTVQSGCVLDLIGVPCSGSYLHDISGNSYHGTVTGATWTRLSGGLWVNTFAGAEYISQNTADWRSSDSSGSIIAWFKTSSATDQAIFCSADTAVTTRSLYLYIDQSSFSGKLGVGQRNNDTATTVYGDTTVTDGVWHLGSVVSSGTAYALYVDNHTESLSDVNGNNGDWFADTDSRDNWSVGVRVRSSNSLFFTGNIGLVRVYSSSLSAAEINSIYQQERNLFGV